MNRLRFSLSAACLFACCFTSSATAHYLWVTVDNKASEHGVVNVYFEESPAPGDGYYLDPFVKAGKTWIRTLEAPDPTVIEMHESKAASKRWLQGTLGVAGQRSIESYGKFGVYRYGQTDVLLHYYARLLDIDSHDALHELGRAERMDLDIVPHDHEDEVELTVLWQKKPASGRMVYIRGPKGFKRNVKTNKGGKVTFAPLHPGTYRFRTSVEDPTPGKDNGKAYAFVRHNATLMMRLPLDR